MINVQETIQAIKQAGAARARAVPMLGHNLDGQHQIEIMEGGTWSIIAQGLSKKMAEDLIRQSLNRVILG